MVINMKEIKNGYQPKESKQSDNLSISIRAVIESCFSEAKEEIQDRAIRLIMRLIVGN